MGCEEEEEETISKVLRMEVNSARLLVCKFPGRRDETFKC